jgi:S1-C subfamily serine protease
LPKGERDAEVLATRPGFYQCRFEGGATAWVSADDVSLLEPPRVSAPPTVASTAPPPPTSTAMPAPSPAEPPAVEHRRLDPYLIAVIYLGVVPFGLFCAVFMAYTIPFFVWRKNDPKRAAQWILHVAVAQGASFLLWGVVFVALRLLFPDQAEGASAFSTDGKTLSAREIAAASLPSVVAVSCERKSGTAFFVAPQRLVTNEHVTCGTDVLLDLETTDGRKAKARVARSSTSLDAAILEVEGISGKPLPLGTAGTLEAGDAVMVIGNPVGLTSTFHSGTVSNPRRVILGLCHLQLDARVNPGNSGGPALDSAGRVVGLVTLKWNAEGIGMALPIDYLYEASESMLDAPPGHPSPGFSEMLEHAKADKEKLAKEKELGIRLVGARRVPPLRVRAALVTTGSFAPSASLEFRLYSGSDYCRANADVSWSIASPGSSFGERAREYMRKEGLGEVYVGAAIVDFNGCKLSNWEDVELGLAEGDPSKNRVPLQ